jgi:fatty acid-binding protein DegV
MLLKHRRENELAMAISMTPLYPEGNQQSIERFDALLKHALYLPSQVIVVDTPKTKQTQKAIAELVNERLQNGQSKKDTRT